MKTYRVSYYLGNMLHSYLIDAEHENEAIQKALTGVPSTSRHLFHDFKIERYFQEWN